MKKGFSLIELLIVVVIVGILVTAALPKYRAAMERGRAQEAIANLKEASDVINLEYVRNDNQYRTQAQLQARQVIDANRHFLTGSFTKQHGIFGQPTWNTQNVEGCRQFVDSVREGNEYTLRACNDNGQLNFIACLASPDFTFLCEWIGADAVTNNPMYPYQIPTR